jgi:hypothetical protein
MEKANITAKVNIMAARRMADPTAAERLMAAANITVAERLMAAERPMVAADTQAADMIIGSQ